VIYEVTPTALKEKIVLSRPPSGAVSYTFALDSVGLAAQERPDGSIAFVRPSGGQPDFVLPAPYMYDAAEDAGSPHGKVWSDQVSQKVNSSVGTTTVTITPDTGWLTDPARVYPVVIDPTIKVQPVPTDAQDVAIYSGSPNQNHNNTYQLKVGTDASQSWRSLVKFDLSSIPPNTPIDDARLELFYSQTHYTWEYDVAMEARRVTAPWTESTATWANMSANIAPGPAGNMVQVDDGDAGTSVVGTWSYSTNPTLTPLAVNGDYRVNNDTATGHTHTWVPTITESGDYQVEVHFVAETDRPVQRAVHGLLQRRLEALHRRPDHPGRTGCLEDPWGAPVPGRDHRQGRPRRRFRQGRHRRRRPVHPLGCSDEATGRLQRVEYVPGPQRGAGLGQRRGQPRVCHQGRR
jgi:hypothetical protein